MFVICGLLGNEHSDGCEVISHCLDLRVSNNKQYWAFFMCLLAICMSSLEKCVHMSLIKAKRQIYRKK